MTQTFFPNNNAIFQEDNVLVHTAGIVHSRFQGHKCELQRLPWPAQSPDSNIIEPLWSVSETRLRNRFPSPTSLNELEEVLQEEWCKMLLETVNRVSIPKQLRLC
jgi:hypothetical protein